MSPFVPVYTGHTQTVLGHIVPSITIKRNYPEHILALPDGDELHLLYWDVQGPVTVILCHGLGGNSDSDYIRRAADIAVARNWNVILVNHRRASNKAKAKKSYHSGRGEDLGEVILWARSKFKNSTLVAAGFSMSGSILLNLLSYRNGKHQPDFGIVVNAPLDLKSASKKLSEGFSKTYDIRFFLVLKKLIEEGTEIKLPVMGRTYDIDEIYTSKANGFINADDYYERCSTFAHVASIDTKTFVLSSYDDPFIDVNFYLNANWSNNVHLTLQKHGGHMGYFNKIKDPKYGRRWLDHYLESVFGQIENLR
jgi:predicted alpha/beta-fold hydrolase